MCRYAMYGPYKDIYACFDCQKSFKQKSSLELTTAENEQREYLCPQCSKPMINMGHDFKTPPKNDQKQWQKVKILYQHGFTYHSCGCGGPGYRPKNLNQVQPFLEANKQLSAGERLLQKIGTKKSNPS